MLNILLLLAVVAFGEPVREQSEHSVRLHEHEQMNIWHSAAMAEF